MRIFFHDYAGQEFTTSLSRALAARGHEVVHAFASSLNTPRGELFTKQSDSPTLSFREILMDPDYARRNFSFRRRRSMEVRYGRAVAKFINGWKPDVVISGNTPTETQEPISRAATAGSARFYYWVQDFYSQKFYSDAVDRILSRKIPLVGGWVSAWYHHLNRRQFGRSSQIITTNGDFSPILSRDFGVEASRISVVPSCALIEEIPCLPKDNGWSRRHALHDKFVFLYSGAMEMKHNPALLLELARHHAEIPEVRVVVVSEGDGAAWLRKEAAAANLTNMLIIPYQPNGDLPSILASGDVLVDLLAKKAENFSVPPKILNYLCAGRPLLLAMPADHPAARITREHVTGLTAAPDATDGFLAAASALQSSPGLCAHMARNARAYAEETFPIEKAAAVFDKILMQ